MSEYIDRYGNPIPSMNEWAALSNDPEYCHLGHETIAIPDGWITIKAYWDGRAEQYGPTGPMIWRTMVHTKRKAKVSEVEIACFGTPAEAMQHFHCLVDTHTQPDEVGKPINRWASISEDLRGEDDRQTDT